MLPHHTESCVRTLANHAAIRKYENDKVLLQCRCNSSNLVGTKKFADRHFQLRCTQACQVSFLSPPQRPIQDLRLALAEVGIQVAILQSPVVLQITVHKASAMDAGVAWAARSPRSPAAGLFSLSSRYAPPHHKTLSDCGRARGLAVASFACARLAWRRRLVSKCQTRAQPGLESVLTFWFGDEVLHARDRMSDEGYLRGRTKMWYLSGSKYDEAARGFLPLLEQQHEEHQLRQRDELPEELHPSRVSESEDMANLARVVLFDQIPRNAFRGMAKAFYYDQDATEVSEELLKNGFADSCSAAELLCLVQPLSHSELPGDASRIDVVIQTLQRNMRRFSDGASKMIMQVTWQHSRGPW